MQIKDPDSPTSRIARRNLSTRNLERWWSRGTIDDRGYRAGDRYRSLYERAGFAQRVTSTYDIVTAGGQAGFWQAPGPGTEAQMDCWRRWREARDDLGGLAHGFDQLILHDALLDELEPPAGDATLTVWTHRRTVMLGVEICIDRLVRFWRL